MLDDSNPGGGGGAGLSLAINSTTSANTTDLDEDVVTAATATTITTEEEEDPLRAARDDDTFVVILFVEEGVRFGGLSPTTTTPYPSCSVVVSATFVESIETNAVPLSSERPAFREELAFTVTKGELVECMANRDAVAVKAYLVNADAPETERILVGSTQMLLHSARPTRHDPNNSVIYKLVKKKLLGGEIHLSRIPALKLSLAYEPFVPAASGDTGDEDEDEGDTPAAAPPPPHPAAAGTEDGGRDKDVGGGEGGSREPSVPASGSRETGADVDLYPELDLDAGCFVLRRRRGGGDGGQRDRARSVFKLTIQIIHAKNMDLALPASFPPTDTETSFRFHFSVFGRSDIDTQPFLDPADPDFMAETVDVRIASTFDDLTAFFRAAEPLAVSLRCSRGEDDLAATEIPMAIPEADLTREALKQRAFHRESFAFFPIRRNKDPDKGTELDELDRPRLGFEVRLSHVGADHDNADGRDEVVDLEAAGEEQEEEGDGGQFAARLEEEVLGLEQWKLKRKEKFNQHLKQQEKNQDAILSAEFRQRESERERAHRAKLDELTALGEELRGAIARQEKREKAMREREAAVRERERRADEKAEKVDRVKSVLDAEAKRKVARLEQEKRDLSRQVSEREAQVKDLEGRVRQAEKKGEEAARRAKRESEGRLAEMAKSKERYVRAWEKAEAEVAELRAENERRRDERLDRAEAEVAELRKKLMQRNEAARISDFLVPGDGGPESDLTGSGGGDSTRDPGEDDDGDEAAALKKKISDISERRESLLRTGVYGPDDHLVVFLQAEISTMRERLAALLSEKESNKARRSGGRRSNKKRKSAEDDEED